MHTGLTVDPKKIYFYFRLGDNLNKAEGEVSFDKNGEKSFDGTFRRLSAAFEAMEAAERDALENSSSDEDEERRMRKQSQDFDDNDQIELGEEGTPNLFLHLSNLTLTNLI